MAQQKLGTGINVEVKGNIVTLSFDVTERHGMSSSGKTEIVASTSGNVRIPGHENVFLGLNAYVKPAAK